MIAIVEAEGWFAKNNEKRENKGDRLLIITSNDRGKDRSIFRKITEFV